MKSKKGKSRENETIEFTPPINNFNEYFQEFHKMFNHCKYNLVALNKKFDALEMFFKNYILKERNPYEIEIPRNHETSNRASQKFKNGSIRRNSYDDRDDSNLDNKTEKEENFPISIEDLDYLTKNFITEEANGNLEEKTTSNYKINNKNSQTSSRKKKNQIENSLIIKNKDIQLDESLVEFFGKNNIGEEEFTEMPVQLDKNNENNFVQKLFDYKSFSQSLKKNEIPKDSKERDEPTFVANNNDSTKENENSKWISKIEVDSKSSGKNYYNIKILLDLKLSLSENLECDSFQHINRFNNKLEKEESKSQSKTRYSEFSNFMKVNNMSLKKKFTPNIIIQDVDDENRENSDENVEFQNEPDNMTNMKGIIKIYKMKTLEKSEEVNDPFKDREIGRRLLNKKQKRPITDCDCKNVRIKNIYK